MADFGNFEIHTPHLDVVSIFLFCLFLHLTANKLLTSSNPLSNI